MGLLLPFALLLTTCANPWSNYSTEQDICYRTGDDLSDYAIKRCRLDVYHPADSDGFSTVVWFHGGGLTGGNRKTPKQLTEQGVAVVAVNYRLSPQVKTNVCVDDAAAAVAWVLKNIEQYGGDPSRVFVSGHSAGGYLASMVGLDKRLLQKYDCSPDSLAGLIPFSGHTITHFTIRKERGIDGKQPIVDHMAPLFHVRADSPPILLITGDREKEMLGRYEENAYLWRMFQVVGHPDAQLFELQGYGHGMTEPAFPLLLNFVRRIEKSNSH